MQLSTHKLKQIRNQKGWSQEVLATASGLALRTIQRIEAEGRASAESTLAIASAYEISPTELQSSDNQIEVNWTRKTIMNAFIAIAIIATSTISLMNLSSNWYHYLDLPTLMLSVSLTAGFSLLAFGFDGLIKSVGGIKYLFANEVIGGKAANYLASIYGGQIKFLYASAIFILLIDFIGIFYRIAEGRGLGNAGAITSHFYPFLFLALLYAVIIAEGILRPLKVKLETCDISAS